MRHNFFTVLCCLGLLLNSELSAQNKTCIDKDWKFFLGDGIGVIDNPGVADNWRTLSLPHDWSVETEAAAKAGGTVVGPFSTNSVGGYQTGFTVGGEGWYHKIVNKSPKDNNRYVFYFEGAYNQTDVYVNGKHCMFNPYGYSSFKVDATDYLHDGENHLAVRVRNEGNNTRWYAGSGIYRHVWLIKTPQVFIDEWKTFVKATDGQVSISTVVSNKLPKNAKFRVTVKIINPDRITVTGVSRKMTVRAGEELPITIPVNMNNVRRWSPDSPFMYKAVIEIASLKTKEKSTIDIPFGVRSIDYSAEKGFLLNGESILLRGGCVHHDNGLLGAAAYDRAEDRKLQILKDQGYNAVRTSHGIPSEHFLHACDSIGLMVIDEAFDQWLRKKNKEDYHRYFAEWSNHDVEVMVRRDRNHPSVVMWSIGNEIPGRIETEGMAVAERLRQRILALDTTRPITAAICGWDEGDSWNAAGHDWSNQDDKAFRSLDIGGYNYLFFLYERDHATHPERVMCGLESYPKKLAENWQMVEKFPYVIGDFIWTAMDYLGEAGIGSASVRTEGNQSMFQKWPWYNGWCGDIDLIGQKKPQSYYHDVVWRLSPVTIAVERPVPEGSHMSVSAWGWQLEEQSWTFGDLSDKDTMTVNVYSRSPKVRLYLNGERVGESTTSSTYWAAFRVPYKPGTLRAVNLDAQGRELADESYELQTTGSPAAIRLTADRSTISTDYHDLSFVTVELVDARGRVITSDSSSVVELSVEGAGSLVASGNGSPTDMQSFRSATPKLFQGRALAIVNGNGYPGQIKLTAKSAGLPDATLIVTTENYE